MQNKYKYIAVIKNEAGALKCVINENEKPKFINWLSDNDNLIITLEWSKKHKIIDFASHYDINKCRTFAITKHYESGSEMLHSEALLKGIEVDCIEIREQFFSDDLKEVIGYKAYFKENESTFTPKKSRFNTFIMPEESTDEYILRRLKEKSGEKLRARIDILDDLAKRFGKQENIQSFEEFYSFYNFDANIMIIRQAMAEYERQGINNYKESNNNNGISNPTHNELIFRDFIRANQLTAKWHEFIKKNPLSEPNTSAKNYWFTEQEVKDLLIKTLTELMPKEQEYNDDLFDGNNFKSNNITEAIEFGMKKASNLERLVYLRAISEVQDKIDNAKKNDK